MTRGGPLVPRYHLLSESTVFPFTSQFPLTLGSAELPLKSAFYIHLYRSDQNEGQMRRKEGKSDIATNQGQSLEIRDSWDL